MIQIELFGCTGAGKSTLVASILRACQKKGIEARTGDDFVLHKAGLNWARGRFIRTMLVDIIALLACVWTLRKNLKFCWFSVRTIWRLPAAVGWLQRLNLARNVFKKVGIYEIIRRLGNSHQVVVVDEGTLHAAHLLFVHVCVEANHAELSTFVKLVSLPDLAVYVTQTQHTLVERTFVRGHKRVPNATHEKVATFVRHAVDTFDRIVGDLAARQTWLTADVQRNIFVVGENTEDILLTKVLGVIRNEIDSTLVCGMANTQLAL